MRIFAGICAIGIGISAALPAQADVVPELPIVAQNRVDRAIGFLAGGGGLDRKIRNLSLVPRWLGSEDRFWYAREGEDGIEYRLVDASTGTAQVIARADILATELGRALGRKIATEQANITDIVAMQDGLKATVSFEGGAYSCRLHPAPACDAAPGSPPGSDRIVAPDGRSAVFLRENNLWLANLQSGAERPLTTDGAEHYGYGYGSHINDFRELFHLRGRPRRPTQVYWSPDSQRLLVARTDRRAVRPYPFIEMVPQDGSFRPKSYDLRLPLPGDPIPTTEWQVVSLNGAAAVKLNLPDGYRSGLAFPVIEWTPDSDALLLLGHKQGGTAMTVLRADAATGAVKILTEDRSLGGRVYMGSLWSSPAFRLISAGTEFVHMSARDGWVHLYLHDAATGKVKNRITRGNWRVWEILDVDERARTVTFTAKGVDATNPYYRSVHRVRLDGSRLTRLTPDDGDHMLVDPRATGPGFDGAKPYRALSPSGRYLVVSNSTPARPPVWSIRDAATGREISQFDRADASALFAAGYRPPQEMTARAEDGSTLHGLVYRPTDYDPTSKYPIIDAQYGAPLVAVTPRNFATAATMPVEQFNPAATAELGFIVVVVDGRGTPGRSEAFSRPPAGYLADMGLVDHIAFIRELARRDPAADLDRVGISGVSFGGWTTIRAMLNYPDFFKVGIAGAAPGTFHSMYQAAELTFPQGQPDYGAAGALRPDPTAVPVNYAAIDNVAQVDRLRGSLLMIVGEQDENVLPASSLQFFDAAVAKDKDIALIYLPNATHSGSYTSYALKAGWNFLLGKLRGERLQTDLRVPSPLDGRR